jgi:putative Holliday junction resolvase
MALDVGTRRIGVAVSDPLKLFARGLTTLQRTDPVADVQAVAALVTAWEAERLIVGHPLLPSGDRGERAVEVEAFVERLAVAVGCPIELWDESYTTLAATERLHGRGVTGREAQAQVDAEAAAVILEEWMREHGGSAPVSEA